MISRPERKTLSRGFNFQPTTTSQRFSRPASLKREDRKMLNRVGLRSGGGKRIRLSALEIPSQLPTTSFTFPSLLFPTSPSLPFLANPSICLDWTGVIPVPAARHARSLRFATKAETRSHPFISYFVLFKGHHLCDHRPSTFPNRGDRERVVRNPSPSNSLLDQYHSSQKSRRSKEVPDDSFFLCEGTGSFYLIASRRRIHCWSTTEQEAQEGSYFSSVSRLERA